MIEAVKNSGRILSLVGAGLLLSAVAAEKGVAQEVIARVTTYADGLPVELRDEVAGFGAELEEYINNTRWVGDDWKGTPVELNINVNFRSGDSRSFKTYFDIVSQRDVYKSPQNSPLLRLRDEDFNFPYTKNQKLTQSNGGYDPITSVIDFYVYLALGMDLDTYGFRGGEELFSKALGIARRGELETSAGRAEGWSSNSPQGAFSRQNIIRELTNPRFYPIRKFMLDYHYNGLDRINDFPQRSVDSMARYINDLMLIKDKLVSSSTLIRVINDSKHEEFARIFIGYPDATIWDKLLYIDPTHQSTYEAAKTKK